MIVPASSHRVRERLQESFTHKMTSVEAVERVITGLDDDTSPGIPVAAEA